MKTACLTFSCPSCNTSYEIFLKTSPHIIVLNCPTCKTCVSIYNGKITEADKQTIKKLIETRDNSLYLQYDQRENLIRENIRKNLQLDKVITDDDIINLKIDLNNCKTIDDVLTLLCQK